MPDDIRLRFGKRLRKLRKQRGMTQLELGEYLGMDRGYISDIERGTRNVTLVTLELIAKGFGLTPSRLLAGI